MEAASSQVVLPGRCPTTGPVSFCGIDTAFGSLLHLLNLVSAGEMGQKGERGISGERLILVDLCFSVGKLPEQFKWPKKPKKVPLWLTPKVAHSVSAEFATLLYKAYPCLTHSPTPHLQSKPTALLKITSVYLLILARSSLEIASSQLPLTASSSSPSLSLSTGSISAQDRAGCSPGLAHQSDIPAIPEPELSCTLKC